MGMGEFSAKNYYRHIDCDVRRDLQGVRKLKEPHAWVQIKKA